jgi:hypothetical protein
MGTLTPEQEEERAEILRLSCGVRRHKQNPFITGPGWGGTFHVAFKTPNDSTEPLWWTGEGFKDLSRVRREPEDFQTREAAEQRVKAELLDFIRKWRADQVHLIMGW